MRIVKVLLVVLLFGALPRFASAQQPGTNLNQAVAAQELNQVVDKVTSQERAEMQLIRPYTPLVETYIQDLRPDPSLGSVPDGDRYFLGYAELGKGVALTELAGDDVRGGAKHMKVFGNIATFFSFSMQFLPRGFLQMIYVDTNGFDRQHYSFEYVRREFLGEVRCLVFDVRPLPSAGKGRFLGRIWVEDQDYHIVRFNGAYTGGSKTRYYFHFDSWRVNSGKGEWLPAFIYSEESDVHYAISKRLMFKAQTRLWGYDLAHNNGEQEFSKIMVEAPTPVKDQTETANDLSPLQEQRAWDHQAEDNVSERMERLGLMAPRGEVDKVLETVVNNLEVTNNLDIEPEVRCRVLMTSTLESFTIGHTIVVSRGLIDVLPDEASLAAILANELGHVVLGHRIDSQYAFFDRLLFDEKDTFRHFGFARTPEEEQAANQKGVELLKSSPYKDQLATAQLFLQELRSRSKEIPSLISPHLGDRVPADLLAATAGAAKPGQTVIAALPLGGRIKLDPWSDQLQLLKSKPAGTVAEREKMPFEVTPFILYLTRNSSGAAIQGPSAASAQSNANPTGPVTKPE